MLDNFLMPSVHSSDPPLIDPVASHPFLDGVLNFGNIDPNGGAQFSLSDLTNPIDPQFVEISNTLSSRDNPDLILGDLTNWNAANPQPLAEGFASLQDEHPTSLSPIPAFPGAEGFGALSVGGRGGRVIEVTNLKDSGPGSLREAMEAEGSRIVVFRVGGTIRLQSTIRIQDPYLTVAGQTAPGGGILIRGTDSTLLRIEDEAHDIIIRYLRLRNGSGEANGSGHDNISINGGYNIILDHVSMSWSTDENASIYRKRDNPPIYNVTIQRSTLGEGLDGHSTGLIVSGETDFSDPNNPIEAWKEVYNISVHHNLFIHNDTRNPRVTSSGTQVINNTIYNWGRRIGETTRGSIVDVINNYAQAGPISNLDRLFLHENYSPSNPNEPYPAPSIYTEGNVVNPIQRDPNADNWNLWKLNFSQDSVPPSYRRSTPLQQAPIPINVQSANDAYESVLADVGANARLNCQGNWVFNADDVDRLYLRDILNHRGYDEPISHPHASGGYPDLDPGTPCTDSDRDGMPNLWENQHQLNPQDPTDGSTDADGDGYTNIEEYLNGQS
jgi:pectate lyase